MSENGALEEHTGAPDIVTHETVAEQHAEDAVPSPTDACPSPAPSRAPSSASSSCSLPPVVADTHLSPRTSEKRMREGDDAELNPHPPTYRPAPNQGVPVIQATWQGPSANGMTTAPPYCLPAQFDHFPHTMPRMHYGPTWHTLPSTYASEGSFEPPQYPGNALAYHEDGAPYDAPPYLSHNSPHSGIADNGFPPFLPEGQHYAAYPLPPPLVPPPYATSYVHPAQQAYNGHYCGEEEAYTDGEPFERADGVLGADAAPVLSLPPVQPSVAVSSSYVQEALWKLRCLSVTCAAASLDSCILPNEAAKCSTRMNVLTAPEVKRGRTDGSGSGAVNDKNPSSAPMPLWDAVVWRWLVHLGMADDIEEVLHPGAQRVLVTWASDEAAYRWMTKAEAVGLRASQPTVFEGVSLQWN